MSRHLLTIKGLAFVLALFVLAASDGTLVAQKLRGPNAKQPVVVFPPAPQNFLLNNGSLYTFPNPANGQPGQLPFAFIAVASQDCRLYHNGATLMPVPRLISGLCTDMTPAVVPLSGGFIPNYGSSMLFPLQQGGGGGNNGGGQAQGFGAQRPSPLGYPAYPVPYPMYGMYGNMPYQYPAYPVSAYASPTGGFATAPAAADNGNGNNANPGPGRANFFNADPQAALGNFGGNADAFGAFGGNKNAADDDKKKANDKDKDQDKPNDKGK